MSVVEELSHLSTPPNDFLKFHVFTYVKQTHSVVYKQDYLSNTDHNVYVTYFECLSGFKNLTNFTLNSIIYIALKRFRGFKSTKTTHFPSYLSLYIGLPVSIYVLSFNSWSAVSQVALLSTANQPVFIGKMS